MCNLSARMTRSKSKTVSKLCDSKRFLSFIKLETVFPAQTYSTHISNRRNSETKKNVPQRIRNRRHTGMAELWCYCQKPDIGTLMIMCDNHFCRIKWFHVAGLKNKVNTNQLFFCDDCLPPIYRVNA